MSRKGNVRGGSVIPFDPGDSPSAKSGPKEKNGSIKHLLWAAKDNGDDGKFPMHPIKSRKKAGGIPPGQKLS
jgi:hypothetical protein